MLDYLRKKISYDNPIRLLWHRLKGITAAIRYNFPGKEIILPEKETDLELLCRNLRDSFKRGKRSSIIVVAEGNEVAHTVQIAQYVQFRLKVTCRVCILGHLQRGGAPTARDRVLASKFGIAAVEGLFNGKEGHVVVEHKGQIEYIPFHETWETKKEIDTDFFESSKVLAI